MKPPRVQIMTGIDGACVVYIDTDPHGGENKAGPTPLRINLNDEPIYENPPLPLA